MRITDSSSRRRAFTLIELLVVILIIAILAALIVPRIVNRAGDAKLAKARSDIAALTTALNAFRLDCDRFPSTEEGLDGLRNQPGEVRGWRGPYLEKPITTDPWGTDYVYEYPGARGEDSYVLMSYGADGAPGGEGDNMDIGSEEDGS